jgi:hypothetical protein
VFDECGFGYSFHLGQWRAWVIVEGGFLKAGRASMWDVKALHGIGR